MKITALRLSAGHHDLSVPVLDFEVDQAPGHQAGVVLIASVGDGPGSIIDGQERGRTATTLAFRMDHQAAMKLHAQLSDLGRSMGWLPTAKAPNPS
jgi:hypothetical protein